MRHVLLGLAAFVVVLGGMAAQQPGLARIPASDVTAPAVTARTPSESAEAEGEVEAAAAVDVPRPAFTVEEHPEVQPPPVADVQVTMVRTAGPIPDGLAGAFTWMDTVTAVVGIDERQVGLVEVIDPGGQPVHRWPAGWQVPVDLIAADPVGYAALLPEGPDRQAISALGEGEVLLGTTEASLRDVQVGARLHTADALELLVVGVVADEHINAAGGVVHPNTLGGLSPRFLAVAQPPGDDPETVVQVARAQQAFPRALGPAPWSTTWREVTPLSHLKQRLGEFAFRDRGGRAVEIEPAWVEANIVTRSVPLIGQVTCHRLAADAAAEGLATIVDAGLAEAIDPGDYAGCFSPRRMSAGGPLSRHSFGIALDLNATTNGLGAEPTLDPGVVQAMEDAGFWWGGRWPRPDGMHVELR